MSDAPSVMVVMTGSVAPGGRRYFTCCTFASTAVIDRSAFALRTSLALTWLFPWLDIDVRYSMPFAVVIALAIGVVTKPCITSCVAPGELVWTTIVALSMLGYSRPCSAKSAAPPVRRIRRLTTSASIGRRMKGRDKGQETATWLGP